jgi:hypothetical protein
MMKQPPQNAPCKNPGFYMDLSPCISAQKKGAIVRRRIK